VRQPFYGKDHKKELEKLRVLFVAIKPLKDIVPEHLYKEIRYRLAAGSMAEQEAEFLQDRRRTTLFKFLEGKTLGLDDI
jgi:hypothetical protein